MPVCLLPAFVEFTLEKRKEGNSGSRVQQEGNWKKTATVKGSWQSRHRGNESRSTGAGQSVAAKGAKPRT